MENNSEFKLYRIKGVDLFAAPKDFSLAHCVDDDFEMNGGIALQFK